VSTAEVANERRIRKVYLSRNINMNMTVNDWLSEIKSEIESVVDDNRVFTKGIRETVDGVSVSITITEQSDYYEAYVVAEHKEDSKTIEDAKEAVRVVQSVLSSEDHTVSTERKNRWAESNFRVNPERIRRGE